MKEYPSIKIALQPVSTFVQDGARRVALGKPHLPKDTSALARPKIRLNPILPTDAERQQASHALTAESIKHPRMHVLEYAIDQIWQHIPAVPSFTQLPESLEATQEQLPHLEATIPFFGNFIPHDKPLTELNPSVLIKIWQVGVFAQGEKHWLDNLAKPRENRDEEMQRQNELIALHHLAQFQQIEGMITRRLTPTTPYSVILEGASANIAAVCNAKQILPELVAKTNTTEHLALAPQQIDIEPLIVVLAMGEINRFRFLMEKLTDTTPTTATLAAEFNMEYFEIRMIKEDANQRPRYILTIKEDYLKKWNDEYQDSGRKTGEIVTGCPALPSGVIKRLTEWSSTTYDQLSIHSAKRTYQSLSNQHD